MIEPILFSLVWWTQRTLHFIFDFIGEPKDLLPPANEVWGKVMFLQTSVILLTGGGLPQCMLAYYPTPPEQTPPPDQAHPPRAEPPPGAEHAGRYGQRVGGTYPTGMQSCFIFDFTGEPKDLV